MVRYFMDWLDKKLQGRMPTLPCLLIQLFVGMIATSILLVVSYCLIFSLVNAMLFHELPTFNLLFDRQPSTIKHVIYIGIAGFVPAMDIVIYKRILKRKGLK